jgi:hypothetical protein
MALSLKGFSFVSDDFQGSQAMPPLPVTAITRKQNDAPHASQAPQENLLAIGAVLTSQWR